MTGGAAGGATLTQDADAISEPSLWWVCAAPDVAALLLDQALSGAGPDDCESDLAEGRAGPEPAVPGPDGPAAPPVPDGPEVFKAGFWDRSSGAGAGFASGGVSDRMPPGAILACLAEDTWRAGLGRLTDDELIGVLRAARRLSSWASALELSAAGDLLNRRLAEEAAGEAGVAEHASDEIAAALVLTARAAGRLEDQALALGRLPVTMRALAAGEIDLPRALVIADEVSGLSAAHAAIVEQVVIKDAACQTTGQLRAAVRRAVIVADPEAVRARRESAEREARVERWDEPAGTAGLAGRDLPAPDVLAADANITAIAGELRAAGLEGTMDHLRAQVFLALLSGRSPYALVPAVDGDDPVAPAGAPGAAARYGGHRGNGVAGTVNLTMPVSAWLGFSDAPGDVAGFGPLDAGDSRDLLERFAMNKSSRWCLTLTDAHGQPVAHGCAPSGPGAASGPGPGRDPGILAAAAAWLAGVKVAPLEVGACGHRHQSLAYRPPPLLRHLIGVRQRTCSFPGCRRPAHRCDQDHTLAFDQGGITCECNLAPLCRRHHRAKQSHGWRLEQPQPGVMVWTTPSGRSHVTGPTTYPDG